jgi:NADPH:quinone reductase-like Zn-dependent oxidoreductase
VGLSAIQIARARGARLSAVASTAHQGLMRRFGADATVDYRTQRFEDTVRDVDLALDSVSVENALRTLGTVKRGGRLVLLSFPPDAARCEQAGVTCSFIASFRPEGDAFARVAELVAQGKLRVPVGRTFPLSRAGEAQALSQRGGTPGKIVLLLP